MKLNEILKNVIDKKDILNDIEVYNNIEKQSERMMFNYAIRKRIPVLLEVDEVKSIIGYAITELLERFKEGFEPISYYWKILITTFINENIKKQNLKENEISDEQKGTDGSLVYISDLKTTQNEYCELEEYNYFKKKIKELTITERQKEVLLYVLEGYSYEKIGQMINTSRQNINQILKKLHKKDEILGLLNRV